MSLTLYHWWGSTCSRKVRSALAEKGVSDWESVHIDLHNFENWAPWYVEIHPNGVVPALKHNGRIVIESSVIMEYIDDAFDGPSLKPEDAWERARSQASSGFSDCLLYTSPSPRDRQKSRMPSSA